MSNLVLLFIQSDGEDANDIVFKLFTRYVGNKGLADPYDLRDVLSEAKKKSKRFMIIHSEFAETLCVLKCQGRFVGALLKTPT